MTSSNITKKPALTQNAAHDASKKILVIKLSALGDFIQALGPMAAIRRHHKDAHITLLTTPSFKTLGQNCGYFDEIWTDERPKWHQPKAWWSLTKQLNSGHFDRVYDLQNSDRTAFYLKLFHPRPEWVGAAPGASHRNTSPQRTAGHAYDGHVQTLALAGITDIQIDPLKWMKADISAFTLEKPYVLLIPGSAPSRPEKRWPAKHYAALANQLLGKNLQPVLLGTAAEKDATQAIKEACPQALDLSEKTNLAQIVTLAHGAAAAIGNDTGPMHLIAATGCPSLTLFSGASNPVRHAPKGNKTALLQENILENLEPARVLEALNSLASL